MDLSKLPKFSETKPQTASSQEINTDAQRPAPSDSQQFNASPMSHMAEAWIGAIIGLVLVLYTRSFGMYLISLISHQPYHTGVEWTDGTNAGQEVPYPRLEGGTFYSDSSIFFFGVALLIGALAEALLGSRSRARRGIAWVSIACMFLATVYCLVAMVILFRFGAPLISILCVGVGVYILYHEWQRLRTA